MLYIYIFISSMIISTTYASTPAIPKEEINYTKIFLKPSEPYSKENLMVCAAEEGNLKDMNFYLEKEGVSIDAGNQYGSTALAAAASNGRKDIVLELIKKGANPFLVGSDKFSQSTPLELAKFHAHRELIPILSKYEKEFTEKQKKLISH